MSFYLLDNRPASPQFRDPRREPLSGVVVVHTAENVMDNVGPDTGAENIAAFIARRSDPGSYHELVDSDSVVPMLPDHMESFQVAVDGHNRHAWGISFACRTQDLNPDNEWTRQAIAIAGVRIRQFWERNGFGADASARWISRGQAIARDVPGLVTHGELQPADRSDAWTTHPRRGELEQMLVDAIRHTGDDMPLTSADIEAVAGRVRDYLANPNTNPGTVIDPGARATLSAIETGLLDPVSGLRVMVAKLTPAEIAAAIPGEYAKAVADLLARRLAA